MFPVPERKRLADECHLPRAPEAAGSTEAIAATCSAVRRSLVLHQPDPQLPHRLLAVCEAVHGMVPLGRRGSCS